MELGSLLSRLGGAGDPDVLVGFETSDDAGVYRLRDDLALVQTVDFITPICDDPRMFGRIAAANSLSDVYAMGGRPVTALNICCFPPKGVPVEVLGAILEGGAEKIAEAGAALVGGHTVKDDELKYGLSVTGVVDPARILRNSGARPGDAVLLTKPLGTGLLFTGWRKGVLPLEVFLPALRAMAELNRAAASLAVAAGASAATDVTGFAIAGHALEVARASGVGIRLRFASLPIHAGTLDVAARGLKTGMAASNRALAGDRIRIDEGLDGARREILFDPQTSGGLLLFVAAERAGELLRELHAAGVGDARIVGETFAADPEVLQITAE